MADPTGSDQLTASTGSPFAAMPVWILAHPHETGIPDFAVRLFGVLCQYYNRAAGCAYPGRQRLAADLDCSVKTIDRGLAALVHARALAVLPRHDEAGRQTSNLYVLQFDDPALDMRDKTVPREGVKTVAPEGVKTVAGEGVRNVAQTRSSTEPDLQEPDPPRTSPRSGQRAIAGVIERERSTPREVRAHDAEDGFEIFWRDYPRKVGKGAARKVWLRLKPSPALRVRIATAIDWQRRSDQWLREGGQFIPHPATYLNQERWADEPHAIPFVNEATLETARTGDVFRATVRQRAAQRAEREKLDAIEAGTIPAPGETRRYLPDHPPDPADQKENPTR